MPFQTDQWNKNFYQIKFDPELFLMGYRTRLKEMWPQFQALQCNNS
jgi:hypothetical protein